MRKSTGAALRVSGILRVSTASLLATGIMGVTSCGDKAYETSLKDQEMAATQREIDKLDAQRTQLVSGEVPNNFFLENLGHYHAGAHSFFTPAYNESRDGKYFVDGVWQESRGPTDVPPSRPSMDALIKIDAALAKVQEKMKSQTSAANVANQSSHNGGGMGMGSMLMMYWMLSGNRGMFGGGTGYAYGNAQAGNWQRDLDQRRSTVSSYAAGNPGYRAAISESARTGSPVRSGQSVRGGFGSTAKSSSFSSSTS